MIDEKELIQFRSDRLYAAPLGGQNEVGQALWIIRYDRHILLVDAGAAYPPEDLPGVDLVFPNLNFLESNQEAILALLLTNGHEEHSGAVSYLLHHINIPVIMAPEFVLTLIKQNADNVSERATKYDTAIIGHTYELGPFTVEWVRVNDAIADACALHISTPAGNILYTSSFKLDQTPVDGQLLDLGRVAQIGEQGLTLLISDSAGVEKPGYTPSEKSVAAGLTQELSNAAGRVIILLLGTNTHRLQLIFNIARKLGRKVILYGEALARTTVAAVATGNLRYDRQIEADLSRLGSLPDNEVLIVATGSYGDPMELLSELAHDLNTQLKVKAGDTIIYSAGISLGSSRAMAVLLDAFLARGVIVKHGASHHIHVSKHAGVEELKLMLTVTRPKFFIPALGEGRHIAHHAAVAVDWGMDPEAVFCLHNGEVLEVKGTATSAASTRGNAASGKGGTAGGIASVVGSIEATPVYYNRDQEEKVTVRSVIERRNLSIEGVITIGCVLDSRGKLAAEPTIAGGGSGFLQSLDWIAAQGELRQLITEVVKTFAAQDQDAAQDRDIDLSKLHDTIRDQANKAIRGRLLARPLVQVVVQKVASGLSPSS